MPTDNWIVSQDVFDPQHLRYLETVFTICNGYLGTRGSFVEGFPDDTPATLVHGLFDDVAIVHTELVNVPNWLDVVIVVDGVRFRMDQGEVLAYRRELDMRRAVLSRQVRWRSPAGHTLELRFVRFASMHAPHVMAIRCEVTSVDFHGPVEVRAGIVGHVENEGWVHWERVGQGATAQEAHLTVRTRKTGVTLSEAIHLEVVAPSPVHYTPWDCVGSPTVVAGTMLSPDETLVMTKLATLYTSRDTQAPQEAAVTQLAAAALEGYDALLAAHEAAWERIWHRSNVTIVGDDEADLALRFSLFHLLCAAPWHDDRVSIPAKTLSGFGYRGHVFWDTEIFMLPFFICTQPQVARHMLLYRYQRLPAARRKAQRYGMEGAMFAWESADTGDETTPSWVPAYTLEGGDELVRIWCGEIELHITADVAYAVYQYWCLTGDDAFMRDYGAEMLLDTARFWGARAEWNLERGVYDIRDVIGPDENHTHVDNSAYTNGMARWNIGAALEVWQWLRQHYPQQAAALAEKLDLTPERLLRWQDVEEKLYFAVDPETHLIEQFAGFYDLRFVDFEEYEPRDTSLQALLGIEETEQCQILKQPDVLMLLYLLHESFDEETLRANWQYYTPRTDFSYGSSLGPAIQATLAVRLGDMKAAYGHFIHAAHADLQNLRGDTEHGIHGASAGGLWQAVIFGFAGITARNGTLVAHPRLPDHWERLTFRLRYHGEWLDFDLRNE